MSEQFGVIFNQINDKLGKNSDKLIEIATMLNDVKGDILEIKENGCPKGYINNGKIKLNKQSIGILKWAVGLIMGSIIGGAFVLARNYIIGG